MIINIIIINNWRASVASETLTGVSGVTQSKIGDVYSFICIYVTGFGKIRLNTANNFFQYHWVKPYGSIFFKKFFMAEMDRHQLALAYDVVVSSGVL